MTYETKDVVQMIEHYKQLNEDLKEDLSVLEKMNENYEPKLKFFKQLHKKKKLKKRCKKISRIMTENF